jgi:hypothetical protein
VQCAGGAVLLEVRNLHAKVAGEDKQILNGVNLTIREGEVSYFGWVQLLIVITIFII